MACNDRDNEALELHGVAQPPHGPPRKPGADRGVVGTCPVSLRFAEVVQQRGEFTARLADVRSGLYDGEAVLLER